MILQQISFDEVDAVHNLYVDFGIRSEKQNMSELTTKLGIQPSVAFSAGDEYVGKTRDLETGKIVNEVRLRPWSVWSLDTQKISRTKRRVEEHVLYLLEILEPKNYLIMQMLEQVEKYTIRFYIRWEPYGCHGSYEISSAVLDRMEKLCHHVEFSFICSVNELAEEQ